MSYRLKKLKRAIFRLMLGMLVLILFAPAVPAGAETAILPGSFTVKLVIKGVISSNISTSQATISWETNGSSTSQVFYDIRQHANITDYAYRSDNQTNPVTQHSISLSGLSSSTTYYYRVKSTANVNNTELIAVSEDYTFTTRKTGGGGGGGYEDVSATIKLKLGESEGITESDIAIDSAGLARNSGQLTTLDGMFTLKVNAGTRLLDNSSLPLTFISCTKPSIAVPPPLQGVILSIYDLGPNGSTFSPPITLTMKYNSDSLSPEIPENSLYIAFWNGSEWQALPSTVDTRTDTVYALISHLTLFALLGTPRPVISTTSTTFLPSPSTTEVFTPTSTSVIIPSSSPGTEVTGRLNVLWWIMGICIFVIAAILTILFVSKRQKR